MSAAVTPRPVVKMKCPSCGSANVAKDALAQWDENSQSWEICGTFENESCLDCEAEGDHFLLRVAAGASHACSEPRPVAPGGDNRANDVKSPPAGLRED